MISRLKLFFVCFLTGMVASTNLHADRLKDLTSIAGVRSNQLVGYGLVVGLAGTGDGNATLTQQALQSMISQFGVVTNAANINGKNAASVIVTAELPPFIKEQYIDPQTLSTQSSNPKYLCRLLWLRSKDLWRITCMRPKAFKTSSR